MINPYLSNVEEENKRLTKKVKILDMVVDEYESKNQQVQQVQQAQNLGKEICDKPKSRGWFW